jgi:putative N6-adenine-specific DNA methylase
VEHLPDFDADTWKEVRATGNAASRTVGADLIRGSDASAESCAAARANLAMLPGGRRITVRKSRFQDLEPLSGVTIVSNPPYGIRLENRERVEHLMKELGDFLKQKCSGSTAWLFFGERELLKSVGLRSSRKIPLRAGGLDGRLVKYDLW